MIILDDGEVIDGEDLIDAFQALLAGDKDMALILLRRTFGADDQYCRLLEETIRA